MSIEESKAVARRYLEEIYNQRNVAAVDELLPPEQVESAKRFATMIYQAFPDMHITIEDLIAEGDKVVVRYTVRGTHRGELRTRLTGVIPSTGKQIEFGGVDIYRVVNGRVYEEWSGEDWLALLKQFGLFQAQ